MPDAFRELLAAARAVLEAPTVEWCEAHKCSVTQPGQCVYANFVDPYRPCEVVRVRLVAEDA